MNKLRPTGRMILMMIGVIGLLFMSGCEEEKDLKSKAVFEDYVTENVIILVVDGPRWSETWGQPEHKYIPFMSKELSHLGTFNTQFFNLGTTRTVPGHTAIITGVYHDLYNNGSQYPTYPSMLQQWLAQTENPPTKAWIISSKKKLGVLGNCSHLEWRNKYLPSVDAEDRSDLETFERIEQVMRNQQPNMVFVNLKGPDYHAHGEDWKGYLHAIKETDSLVNEVYKLVENDPAYAGKTTLVMTNDHGRHLDEVASGFKSHGDHCPGCTHINFFATGPDFKVNNLIAKHREQVDIAPTIGKLMGFEMRQSEGEVMTELFK